MILCLYLLAIFALCCFISAVLPTPDRDDPIWRNDD